MVSGLIAGQPQIISSSGRALLALVDLARDNHARQVVLNLLPDAFLKQHWRSADESAKVAVQLSRELVGMAFPGLYILSDHESMKPSLMAQCCTIERNRFMRLRIRAPPVGLRVR